jgi:biotin synthase
MGPHTWKRHWEMIQAARNIYGPMNVNCHVIVGLGETDRDLIDLFVCLSREKIEAYIFSFNPELGTQMQSMPRASITRHRRVQLAKHLIETAQLSRANICFDDNGMIAALDMPEDVIEEAILSPVTFMTDGCPDREGVMSCNRPYGSYRPGEEFRDYPFVPERQDIAVIRTQLNVEALHPSICEVR